jgi:hypothetical protein
VPVLEQRIYRGFVVPPVQTSPDGTKLVQFLTADGKLHAFACSEDAARELGQQLLAPSVQVASPGDIPPNGSGA